MITLNCIAAIIFSALTVLSVGIDGQLIKLQEAPYQISLEYKVVPVCGGVIIDAKWILTSANCVTLPNKSAIPAGDLIVRAGSNVLKTGGIAAKVKRVIVHDKFKVNLNDLALLELKVPLPVSSPFSNIKTIEIRKEDVPDKSKVTEYGWDIRAPTQPKELKKITTTTMSQNDCAKKTGLNSELITCVDRILARTHCSGDSGGGVFGPFTGSGSGSGQLIGILSTSRGCDSPIPDIFARLSKNMDWINRHMK